MFLCMCIRVSVHPHGPYFSITLYSLLTDAKDVSSISNLLAEYTRLPEEVRTRYVSLFNKDGATDLEYLLDANYSRSDLMEIGIQRPHVEGVVKAIKKIGEARERKGETLCSHMRSPAGFHDVDLLHAIRNVTNNVLLTSDSPLFQGMEVSRKGCSMDMCEALVRILEGKKKDLELVVATLEAINKITEVYGEGPQQINRRRLGLLGACQKILGIMVDWYFDSEAVACALSAICYLAWDKDNKMILGASGGCSRVVAALTAFPKDATVQYHGCRALINLVFSNPENRQKIGEFGGCERVTSLLANFASEADFQQYGLHALVNLATDSQDNRAMLRFCGASERVVYALNAFSSNYDVQFCGVWSCACLALEEEGRRLLGEKGCRAVAKALSTFPSDRELQKQGIWAVCKLSMDERNRSVLVAEKAFERIKLALVSFPSDCDIECYGTTALTFLDTQAVEDDKPLEHAMASGIVSSPSWIFKIDEWSGWSAESVRSQEKYYQSWFVTFLAIMCFIVIFHVMPS